MSHQHAMGIDGNTHKEFTQIQVHSLRIKPYSVVGLWSCVLDYKVTNPRSDALVMPYITHHIAIKHQN